MKISASQREIHDLRLKAYAKERPRSVTFLKYDHKGLSDEFKSNSTSHEEM